MNFDLTYSGLGSGTCQLSPSSLVLEAGVLSGFRLSSLGLSLKFPAKTKKIKTKHVTGKHNNRQSD